MVLGPGWWSLTITHCKYDHVLALSDPLSQLRDLLLQFLGRVEVLFRVVLIARCRCHVG